MKRRRRKTEKHAPKSESAQRTDIGPIYRVTRDARAFAALAGDAQHLFVKDINGSMRCVTHDRPAPSCVPPSSDRCVWSDTLDGGRYTVAVTRTAPYNALLTAVRDGRLISERCVGLMYNAEFSPDYEDVQSWQALGMPAADADYRRRGETPPV